MLTCLLVYCRVHLPRSDTEAVTVRPFDVAGADLSAVVKVHHGGKVIVTSNRRVCTLIALFSWKQLSI